jgi:hypothetical protein
MEPAVSYLEIIIAIGVVWNAVLQTKWYIWSKQVHEETKHGNYKREVHNVI